MLGDKGKRDIHFSKKKKKMKKKTRIPSPKNSKN